MFRTFLALTLFSMCVYAAPAMPSPQESKEHLIKAGLSESAADGLMSIGQKYGPELASLGEQGEKLFGAIKEDSDNFMKTQSESDQQAYENMVSKMQATMQSSIEAFQTKK